MMLLHNNAANVACCPDSIWLPNKPPPPPRTPFLPSLSTHSAIRIPAGCIPVSVINFISGPPPSGCSVIDSDSQLAVCQSAPTLFTCPGRLATTGRGKLSKIVEFSFASVRQVVLQSGLLKRCRSALQRTTVLKDRLQAGENGFNGRDTECSLPLPTPCYRTVITSTEKAKGLAVRR
jgi:hypothetical protein